MPDRFSQEYEPKMNKTIEVFKEDLNSVRAGRANPALLDKIMVSYYGVMTPLQQLANVSAPEARLLVIQPYDASTIPEIEKEIQKSDIGITPSNDDKLIRLPFPQLTEDRRKELTKIVSKKGEDTKIIIRNLRRDLMDTIKKAEKDGDISEDDRKTFEDDAQKLTDKYTDKIDEIIKDKQAELMEV